MFSSARYRSRRKGIPFNIELEDIVVPDRCPVLHIFLDRTPGSPADSTPHLDKIVPDRGYVRGNVQVISGRANRLKSDGKLHELKAIVSYLENSIEK